MKKTRPTRKSCKRRRKKRIFRLTRDMWVRIRAETWPHGVRRCLAEDRFIYSWHALSEMRKEESGKIHDQDIHEALQNCQLVREDSVLEAVMLGRTTAGRSLQLVCAYDPRQDVVVLVTVYEPYASLEVSVTT